MIKWLKLTYKEAYKEFQPRRLDDLIIILQGRSQRSEKQDFLCRKQKWRQTKTVS